MSTAAWERLFGWQHAFDHPATVWLTVLIVAVLAGAGLVIFLLGRSGKTTEKLQSELWRRYYSWLILVPCIGVPILLGAFWTILAIGLLSILCYREYARATGLFRERLIGLIVVLGIIGVTFASLDHWYFLFVSLFPLTVACLAGLPIFQDRPQGYIQRVALGVFGFALCGSGVGHLGFLANDVDYRPILLLVIISVELNDVFAFMSGKLFGRHKLSPATSPNKTIEGSIGALVLTTAFVVCFGRLVFAGTPLEQWGMLSFLGFLISALGQLGDLVLSSIKRDLGLKDFGVLIPGHGGFLDRFDSLFLVAPAVFHIVNYWNGVGQGQPICILSGARG
jgi:phosphatidate cytidylyltransferase